MSNPEEEERDWVKKLCVRVPDPPELKAAIPECLFVQVKSRDASTEGQHTTVGSSAASVRTTVVTEEVCVDSLKSKRTRMESCVVAATLQDNDVAMGEEGANMDTLQSTDATLESTDATVGANDANLGFSHTPFDSNISSQPNNSTLESDDGNLESNTATMESSSTNMKPTSSCETGEGSSIQVSVIIPVYNAAQWLDECLRAVSEQDFQGTLEVSVFDDASTDNSRVIAETWRETLRMRGVTMVISGHNNERPRGVGVAKNKAVVQSSGHYLCFQDADDIMMPQRVRLQYEAAILNPTAVIGCRVRRIPEGSTARYAKWINTLGPEQLLTQVYTSHGPTVVMPTWFCSRDWFHKVGPFDERGKGVPEDLLWFYQNLRMGGGAIRVDECLLVYRYHEHAATHSVLEETIWNLRVGFLEERVLGHWDTFTIWNAGKQGRKLYRSLMSTNQKKVKAFCDVDENKIKKGFYTYEESKDRPKPRIPVVHYRDASPPFVVCVKLDMSGGVFEDILLSLCLTEGVDYYHFN